MNKFFIILLSFFVTFGLQAQERKIIQFSGYVLTPDSLLGIPFVNIYNTKTFNGTTSYTDGFFSFAAETGDTIKFSTIGFKASSFVIPTNLMTNKYSIVKLLAQDTTYIDSVIIYPWPTKELLKQAFLEIELEETDSDRALRNLEREYLREIGETMAYDADENLDYYMKAEAAKFYYAGQAPPQNIFNLFAWAKFIEAWKRGDFKKRKTYQR